jgi:hypothetical protein
MTMSRFAGVASITLLALGGTGGAGLIYCFAANRGALRV